MEALPMKKSKQQILSITIAEVKSFSKPGKSYTIKRSLRSGQLSCNCPAWIFQKGGERKSCKHIIKVLGGMKAERASEIAVSGAY
jgi:predicted nucleic acid-binding Zn finger protein